MPKLKKYILLVTMIIALAVPATVLAFDGRDWNKPTSSSKFMSATDICTQIFKGDSKNIFQEVVCSLIRIVDSSIANFATQITCEIQGIGNAGNYKSGIVFKYDGTKCNPSGGLGSSADIFGSESGSSGATGSGFYNNETSQLTKSITDSSLFTWTAFGIVRSLTTALALIALLVVAFANILHIDINTYAVKKAIPTLILALVGGWISIYIIFLLSRSVDFLYQLSVFTPYQALHPMQNIFGGTLQISASSSNPTLGLDSTVNQGVALVFAIGSKILSLDPLSPSFISGLFGGIFLIIPAIIVFVFEYVMALRPFVVQILTVIAPLAFACLILPQTQNFFKKWWTILLIAIFFAPLVNFVFYLLNQLGAGSNVSLLNNPTATSSVASLALLLVKSAVIFFLIRMPFTLEKDLRAISVGISKTGLGLALGMRKGSKQEVKNGVSAQTAISDKILGTPQAQRLIAGIEGHRTLANEEGLKQISNIKTKAFMDRNTLPNLRGALDSANNVNLSRSADLIAGSVKDLSPELFRAVLGQSDHGLWQNSRLVDQLKNKDGQVLDDEGAAIRADAARKLVRLAGVTDQGKLVNPDALKLMAQKGLLDQLPLGVVQKAFKDGVLNKNDFIPTYKSQTNRALERIQKTQAKSSDLLNAAQAKNLIDQDHLDYSTGFKDMAGLFSNVVKDKSINPPPPAAAVKDIISQMKNANPDGFESNGIYFLKRLGQVQRNSQNGIVADLQKAGAPIQTAIAVAGNQRVDYEQAKQYATGDKLNPESLSLLREGFINRDLSTSLISEVANQVSAQKTAVGSAVCDKISEKLKQDQSLTLDTIKKSLKSSTTELSKPVAPEKAKALIGEINKYSPGNDIKTEGPITAKDIQASKAKGEGILGYVEDLITGGANEKTLSQNPQEAKNIITNQVNAAIKKSVSGEVAHDAEFNTELKDLSPSTKVAPKPPEQIPPAKPEAKPIQ